MRPRAVDHRTARRLAAMWLATACLATACPRTRAAEAPPAGESVRVRVVNHNRLDVTVYALVDGRRERIGLVTASTTANFVVSTRLLTAGKELRLFGDPVGERTGLTSDPVRLGSGQLAEWTIETDLTRSTLIVRG